MEQKAWIFQIKAVVTEDGIEGDGQRNRALHGGTERALCPFSLDRLLVFQQEGTPIFPGAMGENLTLAGLHLPLLCRPVRTGFYPALLRRNIPAGRGCTPVCSNPALSGLAIGSGWRCRLLGSNSPFNHVKKDLGFVLLRVRL